MQKVAQFKDISAKYPKVKSFIFDMDGTVMYTEHLHAMAINEVLEECGNTKFELDVLEEICIGLNDEVVFNKLQKDQLLSSISLTEFLELKTNAFFKILNTIAPKDIFNPKVLKLLKEIKANNNQLALVTSSERETTYQLLDFLKITSLFDIIITREDTGNNKPHPDPYIHAFNLLKTTASESLIFEDSTVGLAAAKASLANVFQVKWYYN